MYVALFPQHGNIISLSVADVYLWADERESGIVIH